MVPSSVILDNLKSKNGKTKYKPTTKADRNFLF